MHSFVSRLLAALILATPLMAQADNPFSFAVIAKPVNATAGAKSVSDAILQTDKDNLAFVLVNGIKADNESCSDALYQERRVLFDRAKNGLIVSLSASDWARCMSARNRSIAIERIARLREMFFTDEFSFGDSKLPLIRQSAIPSFGMYAENMQWRIGEILFATLNLPNNNNNYLNAAGRNSEYEDRQVANADWLKRLFITARSNKLHGIVLFSDANPLAHRAHTSGFFSSEKREGFAEIRRQILQAAKDYHGRILIVHGDSDADRTATRQSIVWKDNIGALRIDPAWTRVTVDPAQKQLFSVSAHTRK
ncbi:hypothetical protein [Oxalicibacterium faecigallinarum]|uniref:Transmembrane protein n=1 Tax=Oxalicibacterium faecigallinarum TaxID=573741 RepID=A0A8J3API0_9BURK|nr:hypothetical protein [Oxalicibacterium faecigallinarum]GGI17708.1 hypothetical protein GCM10008066_10330 [Oxalicibacterium faecigallinarum]